MRQLEQGTDLAQTHVRRGLGFWSASALRAPDPQLRLLLDGALLRRVQMRVPRRRCWWPGSLVELCASVSLDRLPAESSAWRKRPEGLDPAWCARRRVSTEAVVLTGARAGCRLQAPTRWSSLAQASAMPRTISASVRNSTQAWSQLSASATVRRALGPRPRPQVPALAGEQQWNHPEQHLPLRRVACGKPRR